MKRLEKIFSDYKDLSRDKLIPILQDVQSEFGYLSKENMIEVGKRLNLPVSKIYGVATFYNQFCFQPKGRYHIQVCRGTACHVKGSLNILESVKKSLNIDEGETSKDGKFSLEVVACIGACGLAPVVCVNGEFYGKMSMDSLDELVENLKKEEL